MEKYYLVQARYPDGTTGAMLKPAAQIIRDLGFRDCSGTEYEVYDVSEYGKVVKLQEATTFNAPPNYQCLVNPESGTVVIVGYSPEH